MRWMPGLLALWWIGTAGTALAQERRELLRGRWAIGISVGASSFGAGTEGKDADGETLRFMPYRPTMWGLAAQYGGPGFRIGIAARYGEPGLGARGVTISDEGESTPGALIVVDKAFQLTQITAGMSTRLARLRGGPSLRPSLAVDLQRWTGAGSPTRSVVGGQAGLALEIALTRAFAASLEGEIGLTRASPFRKEDLPEGFERRSPWRRTVLAGLYWRF
jgi:hypothetical protein